MKKRKKLIKIAGMITQQASKLRQHHLEFLCGELFKLCQKYNQSVKDSKMFATAINRGWFRSAEKIKTRIGRDLDDFSYQFQKLREQIKTDQAKEPKLSDIFAELVQIECDLGELKFDTEDKTISVVTESIVLDDITLGPFEIKLDINKLSTLYTNSPYRIIALDPNPAGSNSEVTHPHVSSERLCEGDGHMPIRKALEDGRLCDFFTIIISILETYNPDSPFISLDSWEGISCYDCGYRVSEDDSYYCEYCDREYCSQCSTYCQVCEQTVCLGCSFECPDCQRPACKSCSDMCEECEETFCKDCINEENLCETCVENRKEYENEKRKEFAAAFAEALPDSVGEAIVLSGHYG